MGKSKSIKIICNLIISWYLGKPMKILGYKLIKPEPKS